MCLFGLEKLLTATPLCGPVCGVGLKAARRIVKWRIQLLLSSCQPLFYLASIWLRDQSSVGLLKPLLDTQHQPCDIAGEKEFLARRRRISLLCQLGNCS